MRMEDTESQHRNLVQEGGATLDHKGAQMPYVVAPNPVVGGQATPVYAPVTQYVPRAVAPTAYQYVPAYSYKVAPYANQMQPVAAAPQMVPQMVPQAAMPQVVPQMVPQAVPQYVPQAVPEVMPQAVPQAMPQAIPQYTPEYIPQYPQAMPQYIPQAMPQAMPPPAMPPTPPLPPQAPPQQVPPQQAPPQQAQAPPAAAQPEAPPAAPQAKEAPKAAADTPAPTAPDTPKAPDAPKADASDTPAATDSTTVAATIPAVEDYEMFARRRIVVLVIIASVSLIAAVYILRNQTQAVTAKGLGKLGWMLSQHRYNTLTRKEDYSVDTATSHPHSSDASVSSEEDPEHHQARVRDR